MTSLNMHAFISVTTHFIQDSKLHSPVLCTKFLHGRHTAQNIWNNLNPVFNNWSISEKVHYAVTDNASSEVAVCMLAELKNLPCFAYTLNLVVKDMFTDPEVNHLICKIRVIVSFFQYSAVATDKLLQRRKNLGKAVYKLLIDVSKKFHKLISFLQHKSNFN